MKKPSVTSFLITLLLAVAVCTHGYEPVKDTDGNIVRVGEQYSIELVNAKSNGGVIPATINFTFCVNDIIQAQDQPGVPVSLAFRPGFISPTPDVHTNIDITIEFNFKTDVCKDIPMFWEVRELPWYPNPQTAITIGGNPQEQKSRFKIEKVGEDETKIYKLKTFNGAVGARPGARNGALQLVLAKDTDEIILVKFNKVKDATTSRVKKLGLRMFPSY